jgi:hypothetical protein
MLNFLFLFLMAIFCLRRADKNRSHTVDWNGHLRDFDQALAIGLIFTRTQVAAVFATAIFPSSRREFLRNFRPRVVPFRRAKRWLTFPSAWYQPITVGVLPGLGMPTFGGTSLRSRSSR